MKPIVLENVLSISHINALIDYMEKGQNDWKFLQKTCSFGSKYDISSFNDKNTVDHGVMACPILIESKIIEPFMYGCLLEAEDKIEEATGRTIKDRLRIQINLSFPCDTDGKHLTPHTDATNQSDDIYSPIKETDDNFYISAVLFFNDLPDGELTIFNEKFIPGCTTDKLNLTKQLKIKPKKNSMVIFNSGQYHSGTYSRDFHRIVCNFIVKMNSIDIKI